MLNRRRTLTLGAAAALAGCQRALMSTTHVRPIDRTKLLSGFPALAQRARPGVLALGLMSLDDAAQSWTSDSARSFPLAGAAAAPVAAAVLSHVDQGVLTLVQKIPFDSANLSPPPSSIDQRWPDPPERRDATMQLAGLIDLALRYGDDTAIDVLTDQVAGPGAVTAFLESQHLTGLTVDRYQREIIAELFGMPTFRPAWKDPAAFEIARDAVPADAQRAAMAAFVADPRDTTTVPAAMGFLDALAEGALVSPASTARLLSWMRRTPGSRLKPGFPADVRLAVALGATPSDLGVTAATTELAIASWPDGPQYALAAFLTGSTASDADRAALFTDAGRLLAAAIGAV